MDVEVCFDKARATIIARETVGKHRKSFSLKIWRKRFAQLLLLNGGDANSLKKLLKLLELKHGNLLLNEEKLRSK
jgi:hypothetical protein